MSVSAISKETRQRGSFWLRRRAGWGDVAWPERVKAPWLVSD